MASTNNRAGEWYELTDKIRARIRDHLINGGINIRQCVYITRPRLRNLWTNELFAKLKSCLSLNHFDRSDFFFNTILLISALINHGWFPTFGRDMLQKNGLFIATLNRIVTDDDLPLQTPDIRNLFGYNANGFSDGQHAFNPAIVDCRDDSLCTFPEGTRLPFEYEHPEAPDTRGNWHGKIAKVRITKGYFRGPDFDSDKPVVCKTMRHSREFFLQELRNLKLMRQNAVSTEHIVVQICAVYIRPNNFYIVLPWAWASLAYFLHLDLRGYPPWLDPQKVSPQTLFAEVGHVAQALDFLHTRIYTADHQHVALHHCNLKLENILIFEPSDFHQWQRHPLGLWKITDCGAYDSETLSGLFGDLTQQLDFSTHSYARPPTRRIGPHQAPEVDFQHGSNIANYDHAKADVWSYGVGVTKLLAFALEGPGGVPNLECSLYRNQLDGDGQYRGGCPFQVNAEGEYLLRPQLIDWFEHEQRPLWFRECWDCIKENALCIDASLRLSAIEFHSLLSMQFERIQGLSLPNPLYATGDVHKRTLDLGVANTVEHGGTRSVSQRSASLSMSPISPVSPMSTAQRSRELPYMNLENNFEPKQSLEPPTSLGSTSRRSSTQPSRSTTIGSRTTSTTYQSQPSSTATTVTETCSVFAASSSWLQTTICQQAHENFVEHLRIKHFMDKRPKFVALSDGGSHAVFSDGRRLCRATITSNGATCAGEIVRQGRGEVSLEAIKFSNDYVAVHDTNDRIILQSIGDTVFGLASTSERGFGARKTVLRFNVARNGYMAIEYSGTIEVFDTEGRCCLKHDKHAAPILIGLAFNQSGDTLFAITRESYMVWRLVATTGAFSLETETTHTMIPNIQSVYASLIPLERDSSFLMQLNSSPKTAFVFGPLVCAQVSAGGPEYYASSRLLPINHGMGVLCFGRRKRTFSRSTDVLVTLDVSDYGGARAELRLLTQMALPTRLQKDASTETAMCILPRDSMCVRVVESDGIVHDLDLGRRSGNPVMEKDGTPRGHGTSTTYELATNTSDDLFMRYR